MTEAATWYVCRVAPQMEFRVLYAFNQNEIPALLPFEEKWVRRAHSSFPKVRKFPLFPSYVFCGLKGSRTEGFREFLRVKAWVNQNALDTGKMPPIVNLIGNSGRPSALKEHEVDFLQTVSRPAGPDPTIKIFTPGQAVAVTQGPFTGKVATVDAVTRKSVRVMLNVFGGMMPVEMQLNSVEAA